jgi:hypothetical protein
MGQGQEEKQEALKFGERLKAVSPIALTPQRLRSFTKDI